VNNAIRSYDDLRREPEVVRIELKSREGTISVWQIDWDWG